MAVLTAIAGFGFSQQKSDALFVGNMVLERSAKQVAQTPYDDVEKLAGEEKFEQNGYTFKLTTVVSKFPEPYDQVKKVDLNLELKQNSGTKTLSCVVSRRPQW